MSNTRKFRTLVQFFWLVVLSLLVTGSITGCIKRDSDPIRVGILHSLTGTMAESERGLVDAALLAIDEVNASGGVMGRRIEAIVADGQSDKDIFASEAERLIQAERVSAIFGTWTSEHRKAVKEVVEASGSLLFYPLQYEGLEESPNIIYMGPTPNQQIIPAVEWCYRFIGPRMFLVGSDYIFPRIANAVVQDELAEFGVAAVGEQYLPLGSTDFETVVQDILATQPDVILNTINGDSNLAFFDALHEAGVTADVIPVMSFSVGEPELQSLGASNLEGNYSTWSYFQSVPISTNRDFVQAFKSRFGADRVIGDPMEAVYSSVHLWAHAANGARSVELLDVKQAMYGRTFSTPRGLTRIDAESQHTWQAARIGRLMKDGQFEIVWSSETLPPENFPAKRERSEWESLLDEYYQKWAGNWARQSAD